MTSGDPRNGSALFTASPMRHDIDDWDLEKERECVCVCVYVEGDTLDTLTQGSKHVVCKAVEP